MPKTIKRRDINRRAVGEDPIQLENFQEKVTGFMAHRRTAVIQVLVVLLLVAAGGIGTSLYLSSARSETMKLEMEADQAFQRVPQSETEDETKHLREAADLYAKTAATGKSAYAAFQLGIVRMKLAEYDEALAAFQQFLQQYGSTPLAPLARVQMARIKVVQNKSDEALAILTPAFQDAVAGDTALMLAAEILERTGRGDEARTRLREIVDRFPASTWALEANARLSKTDEAVPAPESDATGQEATAAENPPSAGTPGSSGASETSPSGPGNEQK